MFYYTEDINVDCLVSVVVVAICIFLCPNCLIKETQMLVLLNSLKRELEREIISIFLNFL